MWSEGARWRHRAKGTFLHRKLSFGSPVPPTSTGRTKHGVGLADKLAVNLVARYLVARHEDAISV